MSGLSDNETRLNLLIKIIGVAFLVIGVVLAYFTSTTPLIVQVSTVFYIIAALLTFSGLLTLISKFE